MRLGIRLQLLLALGSLLVLAFVPLFFAVASLTRATLTAARTSSAEALGRAVAGHIAADAAPRAGADRGSRPEDRAPSPEDRAPLLEAEVGQNGVAAIGVYDAVGKQIAHVGEGNREQLPAQVDPAREEVAPVRTDQGGAVRVVVPGGGADRAGAVAVVVRVDPRATRGAPLVRLVGLYTAVVALALLFFAYLSMTRLVVRPIEELSSAARRVADGARLLEAPRRGARELTDLGRSLALMTERMRTDEEALRAKIDEIERYADDLSRAQEKLHRSERLASVGRLAAGIAHEIGNPLSTILGFQELLLQGGLDAAEQRDFLERMKRETERIHRVLRDMLDFARPAVHGASEQPEPAGAVADAVADVLALLTPQKSFRGVELRTELAAELPRVALSRPRLVQVLLNLLLNAASAVPSAGGCVELRARRHGDDRVCVEVEDNGPGIAPEIQGRLFEPFATTKDVGEGTGLGLAVCKGLVEAAGGTLLAEYGRWGGAKFVMELPVER